MTTPNDPGLADPDPTPRDDDLVGEISRAAENLEALTAELDECTDTLDTLEQTVDTMLDDPSLAVLVVDADRRIQAVSKGMASLLADGDPPVGRPLGQVAPPEWGDLDDLLSRLPDDGEWHAHQVGEGTLQARRATDAETDAVYVLRLDR